MIGSLELAAAMLLAGAGVSKIVAPGPAAATLGRLAPRLRSAPARKVVTRLGGVGEAAVAVAVFAVGNRSAAVLLAGCYLVFAVAAVQLVRRGQRAPCGCFGRSDSPIGAAHIVLNAVCAAVSLAAAIRPAGPFGGLFDGSPLRSAVGTVQVALLAYLGFVSITALPALSAARRQLLETR